MNLIVNSTSKPLPHADYTLIIIIKISRKNDSRINK